MEAGNTKAIVLSFGNNSVDGCSVVSHHSFHGYLVICVNSSYQGL